MKKSYTNKIRHKKGQALHKSRVSQDRVNKNKVKPNRRKGK